MTLAEFLNGVLEDQPFTVTYVNAQLKCDRCGGYFDTGQSQDWQACPICQEDARAEAPGLFDRPSPHA